MSNATPGIGRLNHGCPRREAIRALIEENLMELKELEKRIQVLEDVEAARKLKARYCEPRDNKQDDDGLTTCLVPSGRI
jgi:hypothetical protein